MKKFPTSILSNTELYNTALRINGIVVEITREDPFIGAILQQLCNHNINLGVALARSRESTFTDMISQKDSVRNTGFIGLRDYCAAFISSKYPVLIKAGKLLTEIFQKHGLTLYTNGYADKSTRLNLLINELEKEEAYDAIKVIGAINWLNDLKEAQQDFEHTYSMKITNEATQNYPLVSESRKMVRRFIDGLLNYIDLKILMGHNNFNIIVEKLDEMITDVVAVARARRTRKENANGNGDHEEVTEEEMVELEN